MISRLNPHTFDTAHLVHLILLGYIRLWTTGVVGVLMTSTHAATAYAPIHAVDIHQIPNLQKEKPKFRAPTCIAGIGIKVVSCSLHQLSAGIQNIYRQPSPKRRHHPHVWILFGSYIPTLTYLTATYLSHNIRAKPWHYRVLLPDWYSILITIFLLLSTNI